MVHRIKKFLYVALQRITRLRIIPTNLACHLLKRKHPIVRPFADPARKRCGDKGRLKYRIQNAKNGVMDDSVAHCRFMYMSHLRVTNVKAAIRAVFVLFCTQAAMQRKDIFLQVPFKLQYIFSFTLVPAESLPSDK